MVPLTSFTRAPTPTTTTPTESFVFPTVTYAPGTFTNCTEYQYGVPEDWSEATHINSCKFIAHISGITISQLLQWNPSLSKDSCTLSSEYQYCTSMSQPVSGKSPTLKLFAAVEGEKVERWTGIWTAHVLGHTNCLLGYRDDEGTPCLDVQDKDKVPGTVSNCNCFTYVTGGLAKECT